jgi:putative transposase
MAESFFASLECELIDRRTFESKTEARLALFTWIEGWYNPRRRHSGLGYRSPVEFERAARTEHGLPTVDSGEAGASPPVDHPAEVLAADV